MNQIKKPPSNHEIKKKTHSGASSLLAWYITPCFRSTTSPAPSPSLTNNDYKKLARHSSPSLGATISLFDMPHVKLTDGAISATTRKRRALQRWKNRAQTSPQKQNKLENTEASDEINSYLYINALDKELFLIVRRNNNMQYKDINI